jgi:hypothetical protein
MKEEMYGERRLGFDLVIALGEWRKRNSPADGWWPPLILALRL